MTATRVVLLANRHQRNSVRIDRKLKHNGRTRLQGQDRISKTCFYITAIFQN